MRQQAIVNHLPLFIMVLIAMSQFVIAQKLPLSPWKGGGFGMFSTVDSPQARRVLVFAEDNGKKTRIPYSVYKELNQNFRILPTRERFNDLIDRFMANQAPLLMKDKTERKFTFEYWKMEFNARNDQLIKGLIFVESRTFSR